MKWLALMIAVVIAGCVVVTVQQGEKNVVDREIDVNRDKDKEERKR